MALLSLLTLYNYDSTLFDGLILPDGMERDTLINNLVAECAELEILYPNPVVLKPLITVWAAKEKPVWDKLRSTQLYEYDPISNYDRTETWKTSGSNSGTRNGSSNGTVNNNITTYDSNIAQPRDSSSTNGTVNETVNGSSDEERTGRAYGNIGVTTTQDMIEAERRVAQFSLYDYIINSFRQRFCLLMY